MARILVLLVLLPWFAAPSAAVFHMQFDSVADNSQWGNPYVDNVAAGDPVQVTVAVDNGGASPFGQTWSAADIVSVTFDFANGAHRTTFDPLGGGGLSSSTGDFVTDAGGALVQVPSGWTDQDSVNVVSTNSAQTPNAWFLSGSNDKYFTNGFAFAVGIPNSVDTVVPANWTVVELAAVPVKTVPALGGLGLLVLGGLLGLVGLRAYRRA